MNKHNENTRYTFKDFLPLIAAFALVITITIIRQYGKETTLMNIMSNFMGSFFLIFASFKLLNLKGFQEAYSTYDIIAKKYPFYGYLYPFIEIALGFAYFTRWNPFLINSTTLILMIISSIGVAQELQHHRSIQCACLGVVFTVPMTYVTLIEDILMAGMAGIMLLYASFF